MRSKRLRGLYFSPLHPTYLPLVLRSCYFFLPSLKGRGDRVSGGRVISAFSSTRAVDITVRWLLSHLYILLAFYSSCAHAARALPLAQSSTKGSKMPFGGFGHGSSFSEYTYSPPPTADYEAIRLYYLSAYTLNKFYTADADDCERLCLLVKIIPPSSAVSAAGKVFV